MLSSFCRKENNVAHFYAFALYAITFNFHKYSREADTVVMTIGQIANNRQRMI